jgi:hypothetical protein
MEWLERRLFMTRRGFCTSLAFLAAASPHVLSAASGREPLTLPLLHLVDSRARLTPAQLEGFWSRIWLEAVRDLAWCGIAMPGQLRTCEVRRTPGDRPLISGLERGVLNFVVTGHIPMHWDRGRGLAGVTTRYAGYHVCLVALHRAHPHRVPLLAVNTAVHELLHALLSDIMQDAVPGLESEAREFRANLWATRLWLFRDGSAVRRRARRYLQRLAEDAARG